MKELILVIRNMILENNDSNYIYLQRGQKGVVDDGWDFYSGTGQHGDGVYAYFANDIPMTKYYTSNGENLHTFKIPKNVLLDVSNKTFDFWEAKTLIYNNPQYKAFVFKHKGHGIPTSKEILITDPSIIEIIK